MIPAKAVGRPPKDPQLITEDDILAALEPELEGHHDADLDELGNLILGEFTARLKDPEARARLPGTDLMKLVAAELRRRELERQQAQVVEERDGRTVLDVVLASELPKYRRKEALLAEKRRVEEYHRRVVAALENL